VTCGNADAFPTLPPVRPASRTPAAQAQLGGETYDGHRPLPCPQAVAVPPISAATHGSRNSAAISGGGWPARPTAAEAIWPTSHTPSQAVRILTRLIRSGADAGDPRRYGRMCRHARPHPAAVQTEAFWARMGGCHRQVRVTYRRGRRCGLAPSRRGVRWPGRRGSWVMSVVQTTALDPNSGMSAAAGRSRAPSGTSGGRRSRSADPAATIGQALPGLPVFLFGLIAHGQPHAPTSVRWPCRV
jgi:hypothetical protein